MNIIRAFIRQILSEGKVDDLKKKYVQPFTDPTDEDLKTKIHPYEFTQLVEVDPSPTKKYLEWIIKAKIKGHNKNDISSTIEFFHKNIHRFKNKDINFYKDLKDLENEVKKIDSLVKSDTTGAGKAVKLFEDEHTLLVRPDDKTAVMKYGANTKWCITMKNASYYEEYTANNVVFYFIINKSIPPNDCMAKIAIAVERDIDNEIMETEYFDAEDGRLHMDNDDEKSLEHYGLDGDLIMSLIKKSHEDALTRPKSILAKIKSGDPVTNDEMINHWNQTFSKEERNNDCSNEDSSYSLCKKKRTILGSLPLSQQKALAKVDAYVALTLSQNRRFVLDRGIGKESFQDIFVRIDDNKIFTVRKYTAPRGTEEFMIESDDGETDHINNPDEEYKEDEEDYTTNKGVYLRVNKSHKLERLSDGQIFRPLDSSLNERDSGIIQLLSQDNKIIKIPFSIGFKGAEMNAQGKEERGFTDTSTGEAYRFLSRLDPKFSSRYK